MVPLRQLLAEKISEYIERKSHSLITLSTKSGVSYNTVKRVVSGEVEPSLETAVNLIRVLYANDQAKEIMVTYFPEFGQWINTAIKNEDMANGEIDDEITGDFITFHLFSLALTRTGVMLGKVEKLYGGAGLDRVALLIDKGLLTEKDEVVRTVFPDYATVDAQAIIRQLSLSLSYFDRELVGTDASFLSFQSESVNLAGLSKIKEAARAFHQAVSEVRRNERYAGEIPFYCGTVLNLLDSEAFNKGVEQ